MLKNTKKETKKFDFFIIEEFLFIDRVAECDRPMFEIQGISKIHRLHAKSGGLIADEWSCTACTPSELCTGCDEKDYYQIDDDAVDAEEYDEEKVYDGEDLGHSDDETESDDDDPIYDNFGPSDIVWAKWGRVRFPAKVASFKSLDSSLKTKLSRSKKAGFVVVQ